MVVAGSCWLLGELGQPCTEVCGSGTPHDTVATLVSGTSLEVVDAVSRRYGLHSYLTTTSIGSTCRHAEALSLAEGGEAAFVYFPESRAWDCLPGESAERLASVYRASCACRTLPPPPFPPPAPSPPPPAPPPFPPAPVVCLPVVGCMPQTLLIAAIVGLMLLCFGLCALVRWCDARAPNGNKHTSMQTFTRTGDGRWVASGDEPTLLPWLSWLQACCCCCAPGLARCWRAFREDGLREDVIERHDEIRSRAMRDTWMHEMSRRYGGPSPRAMPATLGYRYDANAYEIEDAHAERAYSPRGYAAPPPRLGYRDGGGYSPREYDEAAYGEQQYSPRGSLRLTSHDDMYGGRGGEYVSPGVTTQTYASSRPSSRFTAPLAPLPTPHSCSTRATGAPLFASGGGARLFCGASGGGYAGYGATPGGYAALARGLLSQRGVLRVHMRQGKGLKGANFHNGKSDPYVVVGCAREERRTKFIKGTRDPVWNEELEFVGTFDDVLRTGLTLKVMDKDFITSDDPLGEINVSLDALRAGGSVEFNEPLPSQGFLLFSVSWEALAPETIAPGTLHVQLVRATGLKAMDRGGLSDPYVKLTLAGEGRKSKTIKKTLDPVWNEAFTWKGTLRDLTSSPLVLHCLDYDFGTRDDKLGHGSVDLARLRADDVAREYPVRLSEQGTVILAIRFASDGGGPVGGPVGGALGEAAPTPASQLPLRSCGVGAPSGARRGADVPFSPPSCGRSRWPPAPLGTADML